MDAEPNICPTQTRRRWNRRRLLAKSEMHSPTRWHKFTTARWTPEPQDSGLPCYQSASSYRSVRPGTVRTLLKRIERVEQTLKARSIFSRHQVKCPLHGERFKSASDVGMGSIPDIQTDEVELLTCGTEIAVAFGKIGETLGTVERAVLAQSAVPSAHIRCDPRSINHCRNSLRQALAGCNQHPLRQAKEGPRTSFQSRRSRWTDPRWKSAKNRNKAPAIANGC